MPTPRNFIAGCIFLVCCLSIAYSQLKKTPVVIIHGMGDAAHTPGMLRLQQLVENELKVYTASVNIGSTADDILCSYILPMHKQTELFAQFVRQDARLANGFNALGLSQGNLLIRAYVQYYNDPPVLNFISLHGPMGGVAALPKCDPAEKICRLIDYLISFGVYSEFVQDHLAQSNYFRDPMQMTTYRDHAKFLPDLNNEKLQGLNTTYRDNFSRLQSLVLVRAKNDTQVFPSESEWFGAYEDASEYTKVLSFRETLWYREDLFGLKTLDAAGKIFFHTTEGDHLDIDTKTIVDLLRKYFTPDLNGAFVSYA